VPFFVFDQRIALAGAQPREVFLQVLEQAQLKADVKISSKMTQLFVMMKHAIFHKINEHN
jgi:predicted DsbA family dithiol-disulfide isomerase